jgi:hypothetical protein
MRPDWLLLSGLQSARALFHRRAGPPRVAGVLAVKNYSDACSAFESLRALADITIVLDDHSDEPFPYRDRCDEYLTLANRESWNDVANKTLLMYRAFVHGCDWLVSIDDDVVYSHAFQTKADVLSLIDELERRRVEICLFPLRDLWESAGEFRTDGIWGRKTFGVLRRNWFFYRSISLRDPGRRLHSPLFPRNMRPRRAIVDRHTAYHTGCMTREARAGRVEKYQVEDPGNAFQRDYAYMLSEAGLRLEAVPQEDMPIIDRKVRLGAAGFGSS